jgi:hypothetical protein
VTIASRTGVALNLQVVGGSFGGMTQPHAAIFGNGKEGVNHRGIKLAPSASDQFNAGVIIAERPMIKLVGCHGVKGVRHSVFLHPL